MTPKNPTVAVSAPGKVLLAGGYLILDRQYTGLVFGLSARINVISRDIITGPGVELSEIVVASPQFLDAQWRYGYHRVPEGGGVKVTQLQTGDIKMSVNPFVETTLNYALTYIERTISRRGGTSLRPTQVIILADNDYYSNSGTSSVDDGRFAKFGVPLSAANKTGLGSSAALVTSLTASLLSHYLPRDLFDPASERGRRSLHNLAQAAHCAAQGKVGSGFDVAAAVFGSCLYRRFSPSVLAGVPEPGAPGFGEELEKVVEGQGWDVEVAGEDLGMPPGVALRMCDVDCGSQTVGMVKKVLAWRASDPERAGRLWDDLQARNEDLAAALRDAEVDDLPRRVGAVRELIREMGELSGVPIEPRSQTELLDAASEVDGVYGGVVPGAGGFDALALLMRDDEDTKQRVGEFLDKWSRDTDSKVKLLGVKGEVEGVRHEDISIYPTWV